MCDYVECEPEEWTAWSAQCGKNIQRTRLINTVRKSVEKYSCQGLRLKCDKTEEQQTKDELCKLNKSFKKQLARQALKKAIFDLKKRLNSNAQITYYFRWIDVLPKCDRSKESKFDNLSSALLQVHVITSSVNGQPGVNHPSHVV